MSATDGATWVADPAGVLLSDRFGVNPDVLESYGAFDISVVSDLPVFVDPFLLFNSDKDEYVALPNRCSTYPRFLKGEAGRQLDKGQMKSWYTFSEVKQNWLGFTVGGNDGRGPGPSATVCERETGRSRSGTLTQRSFERRAATRVTSPRVLRNSDDLNSNVERTVQEGS